MLGGKPGRAGSMSQYVLRKINQEKINVLSNVPSVTIVCETLLTSSYRVTEDVHKTQVNPVTQEEIKHYLKCLAESVASPEAVEWTEVCFKDIKVKSKVSVFSSFNLANHLHYPVRKGQMSYPWHYKCKRVFIHYRCCWRVKLCFIVLCQTTLLAQ